MADDTDAQWRGELAAAMLLMAVGQVADAASMLQHLEGEILAVSGDCNLPLRAAVTAHLGHCHFLSGNVEAAIRWTEEALRIGETRGDRRGIFHAVANLAVARSRAGDHEGAEHAIQRVIELHTQEPGVDDRNDVLRSVSITISRFGEEAQRAGDDRAAITLLTGALRLAEVIPADANRAAIMNNLAALLLPDRRNLERARQLIDGALQIETNIFAPDDLQNAVTLRNLGNWHYMAGEYSESREAYRRSLAVSDGRDHPVVSSTYVALANLEFACGDDVAAKAALDRVPNADAASSSSPGWYRLARMCDMYVRMGNPAAAEPIAMQLLDIARGHGRESRWYAFAVARLGEVRAAQGQPDARQLLLEGYRLQSEADGVTDEDLSIASNNVGRYLVDQEEHAEAVPFLERALALDRRSNGTNRLHWASYANNLGIAYQALGRIDEGIALLEEVLATRRALLPSGNRYIAQTLFNLGGTYLNAGRLDRALPLLRESVTQEHVAIDHAFAVSSEAERLAYIREVLDSIGTTMSLILPYVNTPEVALLFDLAVQRKGLVLERIASEREALFQRADPELRPNLEALRGAQQRVAELMLQHSAEDDPEFASRLRQEKARRDELERDLAQALPSLPFTARLRDATVEAIAASLPPGASLIEFLAFDAPFHGTRTTGYAAFHLPAGRPEAISMVLIGLEHQVEELVDRTRVMIAEEDDDTGEWQRFGSDLRRFLFRRFEPPPEEHAKLFVAPDGCLNRLPFHVLPDELGHPLLEHHEISYLGSGRDLLRIGATTGAPPGPPVVVASPDFGEGIGGYTPFPPLSGMSREGERVGKALGVQPWMGGEASKQRVKSCRSPRILHFATHGFFVPDGETSIDHVLLRSGIALSGANEDLENGILYAHDVLSMDLTGTELVTLSACETGLGAYRSGEGIYGLRRAFTVAGARSLLVSLWSVPDDPTCDLMEIFYQELCRGRSRIAALRTAQRKLRETYGLTRYWGAFICVGDPGVLGDL